MSPIELNAPDRERLLSIAGTLVSKLKRKTRGQTISYKRKLQTEEKDTDGWGTRIATMGPGLPGLEVYLDRLTGGPTRRFWFGFFSRKLSTISKALDACPPVISRNIKDSDVEKARGGHLVLSKPLSENECMHAIPEFYLKEQYFFFGIYASNDKLDLDEVAQFLASVTSKLLAHDLGQVDALQREFFKRLVRDRQRQFRNAILQAYDGTCALTSCRLEKCLEATHLDRFAANGNNRVTNGILLRADLHRLMDSGLMKFCWSENGINARIHPSVNEEVYRKLDGKPLTLPNNRPSWPDQESIERHASSTQERSLWREHH